jgi:hypothetical protein
MNLVSASNAHQLRSTLISPRQYSNIPTFRDSNSLPLPFLYQTFDLPSFRRLRSVPRNYEN